MEQMERFASKIVESLRIRIDKEFEAAKLAN